VEIAIAGEGELVIRFIDRVGQTLLQERLIVSGSPTMEARHVVPLALRTVDGPMDLAPVLVRLSNPEQDVAFDGETPKDFTRKRCEAIGCPEGIGAAAARGEAPPPEPGAGSVVAVEDRGLDDVIESALRPGREH
jgi:hypothetical protein